MSAPARPTALTAEDAELAFWDAHNAAVDHLRAIDRRRCGCTPDALCSVGQALDELAEDAGRQWGRVTGGW